MKRFSRLVAGIALIATALSATAATFVGDRTDFRDETIYFTMTTRFYDGDPSNNWQCWDAQNLNAGDPAWRGDFKGLIEKLDYIKALGFTAVWITPVVENASGYDYHGYHASNMSKVDHRYESGSVENPDVDFQDLIDAAHARGMKIILDIVLNHTGNFGEENLCKLFNRDWSANQATIDACMVPYTQSQGGKLPDNYLSLAAGLQYAARLAQMKNTDGQNHDTRNFWHHYGSFNWDDDTRWWAQIAGDCVDLNTENQYVANYLVNCYGNFIKMGVDGFRIDTSGHISRLTFNKNFIPQFQALAEQYKAKRNGGDFFMYGEVCSRDRNVMYRGQPRLSPYFYTWKETKNYAWDTSTTSWDDIVVREGQKGTHTNVTSVDQHAADYEASSSWSATSNNHKLNGNAYHTPDHSQHSGFNVIDFPMHWNFRSAEEAWGVKSGDNRYNDATFNVVYVDSHDYAPDGAPESVRFAGDQSTWAENMALMFTFRGIPCIYYGSEIEFQKGKEIDKGPNIALRNSGRAYFGGYITGDATVSDFGQYTNATGNMAATLSHPLAQHVRRLNLIRAAVPALRKGQYSTDGCTGKFAFKRRYTDGSVDSYCLVTISGSATFSGIENGTYTDCVTGDVQTVTNGSLTVNCSGKGNMRVYVLSTAKTPAPGKIGQDGKYLYASSPSTANQLSYDGHQDDDSPNNGGSVPYTPDPVDPKDPVLEAGEYAVFFDNSDTNFSGNISCWVWTDSKNYTGGSWPGQPCENWGNNLWKWKASEPVPEGAKVIFSGGGGQTEDLNYVNGAIYKGNNISGMAPTSGWSVSISPASGTTFTDKLSVTVMANGAASSYYTIDNGSQTAFSNSATFDVGQNIPIGSSVTVKVTGTKDGETKTAQATFTKTAVPVIQEWHAYYEDSDNWGTVYAYSWDDNHQEANSFSGAWPGKKLTETIAHNGKTLYHFHFMPDGEVKNPMIIFNCPNNSSKTSDLVFVNNGIYNSGGKIGDYTTGVNALPQAGSVKVFAQNGYLVVIADGDCMVKAVRLDGTMIEIPVAAGYNYYELPRGFYIVEGTKVII